MHMITYTYTHRQIYNYTLGFDDLVIVGEGSKPALMLSFENNEMCQKNKFLNPFQWLKPYELKYLWRAHKRQQTFSLDRNCFVIQLRSGCMWMYFWNVYGSRDRFSAYPFKHCMPEHLEALCGGLVLVCNPSSSMGRVTRNKSYVEYPADCPSWEHGWEPAYPGWTGTHPNHFSQPVWGASVWDAHLGTRIWPIPAAFDPKEKWQSTAAREQKGPIGGHNNLVLICEGWLVSAISVDHVSTGFEKRGGGSKLSRP